MLLLKKLKMPSKLRSKPISMPLPLLRTPRKKELSLPKLLMKTSLNSLSTISWLISTLTTLLLKSPMRLLRTLIMIMT